MVVILVLLFGVRWRLLPLFVILVGVTWAFGLAGYLGIPLSVVTIAGLPVMLGVGIDYAIQMHSRIEEEVVIDRAEHPIQEASVNLGPALLVVTFDAIFAFLALRFAKVPMIRDFGLLLAVGIAVICVCQHRAAARHPRHPRVPVADQGQGLQPRPAGPPRACGSAICPAKPRSRWRWPASSSSPAASSSRTSSTIQSDPEEWVNQDTQVIRDIDTLKRRDRLVGRARHLRRVRRRVQRRDRDVRHRLRQRAARRAPRRPADRVVDRDHGLLPARGARHHRAAADRRGRRAGLRGGAARHPEVDREPRRRRPEPHLPHRARARSTTGRCTSNEIRDELASGQRRRRT